MAAYPDVVQTYSSTQKDMGGFKAAHTVAGTLKIRSFYLNDVKQITVIHDVDDADKQTLEAFYNTNRKLPFDFTWKADGQTYTCRFLRPLQYDPTATDRWQVSALMEVV